MYQALYRKWRPRTFSDVAGQEHITETLRRQIIGGRLSHAYLFVGTRGTGKTTCAKILSRAVNCTEPVDGDPCNKCPSCVGIENGGILDVLELDAASNNGVDNVRALREEAVYSPAAVKMRVYIIDEVHMLSTAAFNALLKLLEEPPQHLLFILATTELNKVPATILSRCQRFSFKRLSADVITTRLNSVARSEGFSLTDDAAEKLAALSDGSMRDALSLLDQCAVDTVIDITRVLDTIGLAGYSEILLIADAVANRDLPEALRIIDKLYNDGKNMASLLSDVSSLMRDTLAHKLAPDSPLINTWFSGAELAKLSKKITAEQLFFCLEILKETLNNLSRSGGTRLLAELCFIRMCDERLSASPAALLARIERLEGAVQSGGVVPQKASAPKPKSPEAAPTVPKPDVVAEAPPFDFAIPEPPAPPIETAPVAASAAAESADFWRDILKALKSNPPIYTVLSDGVKVTAELQGGVIVISADNPFTINTIESAMFSEPIREAARSVLGRDVAIRVQQRNGNNGSEREKKLDSLSAFDIIKFE